MFEHLPLMLAQEDAPPTSAATAPVEGQSGTVIVDGEPLGQTQQAPPSPLGGSSFLFILMAMLGLMFFMSWRTQSKEKKRRAEMLGALKKGDRVQTVGGVIGSVVEVRENDVLVKVDENANTRIRFTRGAIQSVVNEQA